MLFNFHALDCLLYALGKPVYHKFSDQHYGAWLRDAVPKQDMTSRADSSEKIWVTKENDTAVLYEYSNKDTFKLNTNPKSHKLDLRFKVA